MLRKWLCRYMFIAGTDSSQDWKPHKQLKDLEERNR